MYELTNRGRAYMEELESLVERAFTDEGRLPRYPRLGVLWSIDDTGEPPPGWEDLVDGLLRFGYIASFVECEVDERWKDGY